jgi:hypothetical protein
MSVRRNAARTNLTHATMRRLAGKILATKHLAMNHHVHTTIAVPIPIEATNSNARSVESVLMAAGDHTPPSIHREARADRDLRRVHATHLPRNLSRHIKELSARNS